ncbi:DUF2252 domain-containing protein [Cellulomonas sp. P22]|uniref:DUF2252 domain-containing protein n=1 Tax=Cellulomonas sp. P22 TaxID=3373189 RepID=UPI0037935D2A
MVDVDAARRPARHDRDSSTLLGPVGVGRLSRAERVERGRAARAQASRSSHAGWQAAADRPDPVELLVERTHDRLPELVPIHFGRMLASPFAFYRGAAALMAADLADTPISGLRVQLCGDAHLSNFGGYASAERDMVFDLNDFDETLPGPWEWDLKRLVVSFELAGRERGFTDDERRAVVMGTSRAYRQAVRGFAQRSNLEVWYTRMTLAAILSRWGQDAGRKVVRSLERRVDKAMRKDSILASSRLTRLDHGEARLRSDPPLLVPIGELLGDADRDTFEQVIGTAFRRYRRTLPTDRRDLLEQFHYVDMARKVVGVGSVGTRAWVLLLLGVDGTDPLVLQIKEANESVLAEAAGASAYVNHGARVVAGQRLMQASSDIFLGWTTSQGIDGADRDFYVRQLWDWKLSTDIERQSPATLGILGQLCGWTLARAHARSGDRVALGAYVGPSDVLDRAMADFAVAYADQTERDHALLAQAERDGRVAVQRGV